MRIACVSAVKIEIEWLPNRLGSSQKYKIPGGRLWVGEIASHRLGLFCSGVGPEKARRGMQSLSSVFPAERVFHLVVCRSLTDNLKPETPVVARAVISSYAANPQAIELDPPGSECFLPAGAWAYSPPVTRRPVSRYCLSRRTGWVNIETSPAKNSTFTVSLR